MGCLGRAKAVNPWGGQPALGYRAVREAHKARWEIDDEAAALVRRIFAMCLSGMSTYGITEELSRERVPTARERGGAGWAISAAAHQASGMRPASTRF